MKSAADISPCGKYRSWLERDTGNEGCCVFVMLNPSTADALLDDPTIRRCLNFSAREDCGRLIVVNLFTHRSKNPKDLIIANDPVGPEADNALVKAMLALRSRETQRLILGWGKVSGPKWFQTMYKDRIEKTISVFENIVNPKCFALNKDGSPKHPLYVANDQPLRFFPFMRND